MESSIAEQSPFLRLPTELRLIIYNMLLIHPTHAIGTTHSTCTARVLPTAPDYYDYEPVHAFDKNAATKTPALTLKIRTEDPTSYAQRQPSHQRSRFLIRSDRFRARCMWTTYHLLSSPELSTRLLLVNARIHAEMAHLLYSSYTFDFDTHIEAIVPFLTDLTPFARHCIQSIRIVKRALPYQKCFDNAEWSAALEYISENLNLKSLSLGIVAGKPGPNGWDFLTPYSAVEFEYMRDTDEMEWMQSLLSVKGLVRLDVDAVVEHCPPPMSKAMATYVRFSSSIDSTFAGFLKERMIL